PERCAADAAEHEREAAGGDDLAHDRAHCAHDVHRGPDLVPRAAFDLDLDRGRSKLAGQPLGQYRHARRQPLAATAEEVRHLDEDGLHHPRRLVSLSTSSTRCRRAIATIRPSPTTTSDAATAITDSAKIWPAPPP